MPMLPINVPLLRQFSNESKMHQDNYRLGHLHHLHHQFQGAHRTPKDDQPSSPPAYMANPNEVRFDHHMLSENPPVKSVLAYQSDLLERLNVVSSMHKATDEYSDTRSSSVSSFQADSLNQLDAQDDRLSCCSEDSELSVGKEEDGGIQTASSLSIFQLASSKHAALRRTMTHPDENIDTAEDSCSRTPITQLSSGSVDEMSNESILKSSPMTPPNPLRFPIVRPSPTRLQEEFLRNSQLYAEELMKHQMSFLAATKGLQLSTNNDHRVSDSKPGFRPLIRNQPVQDQESRWPITDDLNQSPNQSETTHFRGIHSHLNAISKITSALGRDLSSLKSPVGSMNSRESSQSPPNQYNQLLLNQNMLLNDSNLKFSIDNILKPSFGRRITDPLLKRSKTGKKTVAQKAAAQQRNLQKLQAATERHGTPIDLTASMTSNPVPPPPSTTPFSSESPIPDNTSIDSASTSAISPGAPPTTDLLLSPANTNATSSSDQDKVSSSSTSSTTTTSSSASSSSSPMVWPAWVYCTRYSDRPSSGTNKKTAKQ